MCIQCIYSNLDWQVVALSASTQAIASRSCARRSAGMASKRAFGLSVRPPEGSQCDGGLSSQPKRAAVRGGCRGREARPSTRDLAPIDTNIGFVLAKIRLEPRRSLKFPRRPSPLGVCVAFVAVHLGRYRPVDIATFLGFVLPKRSISC